MKKNYESPQIEWIRLKRSVITESAGENAEVVGGTYYDPTTGRSYIVIDENGNRQYLN